MRPLVPTLNCVKLKDYLLVPVTIHTICMVLFMPTKTVGTHAATCDRVVLVYISMIVKIGLLRVFSWCTGSKHNFDNMGFTLEK